MISNRYWHQSTLTMFDQLLTRITSPNTKRRHTYHCASALSPASPEVHSDPENEGPQETPRRPRLLERRRRGRRGQENGLRQARSLGRLDGLKEVRILNCKFLNFTIIFTPLNTHLITLASYHFHYVNICLLYHVCHSEITWQNEKLPIFHFITFYNKKVYVIKHITVNYLQ